MHFDKHSIVSPEQALPGRSEPLKISGVHYLSGASIIPPFAPGLEIAYFAMGCFWGVERLFYSLEGVVATAVGYQGGETPNPTYEEVCSGGTGHTESVMVVFDPRRISYAELLAVFWEQHDPTQGMRQGNDVGTQYRSVIFTTRESQYQAAIASQQRYQEALLTHGRSAAITTQVVDATEFYYAEEYHQQYLAKHPRGYCGIGGLGVCLPPALNQEG